MPNEVFQLKVDALNAQLLAKVKEQQVYEIDAINVLDAFNVACDGLEQAMMEEGMEAKERHESMAYIQRGRRHMAQLYLNS